METNMQNSGSSKYVLWIVILIIVAVGIYAFGSKSSDKNAMIEESNNQDSMVPANAMNDVVSDKMMKSGSYEVYSAEKVAMSAKKGKVVLFFRASWCPTCRALDKDIKENLSSIPADLTILDVDYDNSIDLKQKYGVTYQHTLVEVDKDGKMIKKWVGSSNLLALIKEL